MAKSDVKQLRAEYQAEVALAEARKKSLEEAAAGNEKIYKQLLREDDELAKINRRISEKAKKVRQAADNAKILTEGLIQAEQAAKGLSGIYDGLKKADIERISAQQKLTNLAPKTADSFNTIATYAQDLAKLSLEDKVQRDLILEKIQAEKDTLTNLSAEEKAILDNLTNQVEYATSMSKLTEEQKELLETQVKAYEDIKKGIGAVLGTAGLLFSGWRGFTRITLMGAGMALTKLGKTTREFGGYLGGANISATALGLVFDDAADVAKGLSAEMGGMNDVSFANQLNTNLMATNMGISGQEAAKLTGNLARLNGLSIESAQNMADGAKEMAKTAGVMPSAVMADMAASAEEFALFGKEGGANIAKAAVQAAKMGVSLKTMSGLADNLLDFESSINQELELGAMLGKNINLDRARALAYEGDLAGATQETLQALGGVEAFNQMDYFQKKKTAELLGTSVEELQKMVTQQEEASTIGGQVNGAFNTMTETLSAITTGPLGGFVTGLSGAIGTTKEIAGNFKDAGGFLSGMGSKLKSMFGGKVPTTPGAPNVPGGTPPAAPPTPPQTQAGPADQANKMSKIKSSDLIKGAVALLILAAALFVAAKAFQEFGSVTWESVGMGLVALAGLAAIAYILGKAQGEMIKGALAVAILGVALIPFAYAMSLIAGLDINSVIAAAAGLVIFGAAVFALGALMFSGIGALVFSAGILALVALGGALVILGTGLMLVGNGLSALTGGLSSVISIIPTVVEQIAALSQISFLPILGLAGALTVLAAALLAVSVAGLLALPALMALGLIAGGASALMGGGEGGAETDRTGELIEEIKGLRADLNAGKIAVNMDGQKVTSTVGRVVSKSSTNSYAKT